MNKEPLGIYLHIPFCVRKCAYCDFLSFPEGDKGSRGRISSYLEALEGELARAPEGYAADTVYFGGGTPSLLKPEELSALMKGLREVFRILPGAEITLEANPGTLDPEKLKGFREAGISRLSMGAQSFDERELKTIGRIHSPEQIKESFRMARQAGFEELSLDLMFGLPGQSLVSYERSLKEAIALYPGHISAYGLMLEENTPLFLKRESLSFPDEDEEREMYALTFRLLKEAGYRRYEISNYALPGHESRHNLKYWERKEYLGFGLGAASFMGRRRWKNTSLMEEYMRPIREGGPVPAEEEELLSPEEEMGEFMFLGLRREEGISAEEFEKCFGLKLTEAFGPQLEQFERLGLLHSGKGRVRLTERGIDVSNRVFAEFLPET